MDDHVLISVKKRATWLIIIFVYVDYLRYLVIYTENTVITGNDMKIVE